MAIWPAGESDMARRIRAHDWSASPLGPPQTWPQSLTTVVDLMVASRFPMFVAWGPDLVFLYNDPYAEILGNKHPQALGSRFKDIWREIWTDILPFVESALAGKATWIENLPLTLNRLGFDEQTWFTFSYSPLRDDVGGIWGIYCAVAETTREVLAQQALRESEGRAQLAIAVSNLATWDWDIRTGAVKWSDEHFRIEGYEPGEIEPSYEAWARRVHPDDLPGAEEAIVKARENRTDYAHDFRVVQVGGAIRICSARGQFFYDESGAAIRMIGVMEDITERASAEMALRERETLFRTMGEAMADFLWMSDSEGRPIYQNPAWRDYVGATHEELAKNGWETMNHPDDLPVLQQAWKTALARGEAFEVETRVRRRDGAYRWFAGRTVPLKDDEGRVLKWVGVMNDMHDLKVAEAALRESEERQAFLLKLSDALRPLADPGDVANTACRLLVEQFGASRAQYALLEGEPGAATGEIMGQYVRVGGPMPRRFPMAPYGDAVLTLLGSGATLVLTDAEQDLRLTDPVREAFRFVEATATVSVPLVKAGRWVAALTLHDIKPRQWTDSEIALTEDVAERTWAAVERARAEAALRESEERFQQFVKASSGGIWIRDGATLAMEYVSPAISRIYGIESEAVIGDIEKWAAIVVPEDRDIALKHIARARQGESVIHEFRIQRPSDQAFRWIRDTSFPLQRNGHVQRIGGIGEDITEEKLNAEHQGVLLAELQHRVRNIMAIIRAVAARTAKSAGSVVDYAEILSGRLLTLARVQALLTRAANAKVSLFTVLHDELSAQAAHAGQFDLHGPDVPLSAKAAETMTLAIHELTTNALKYGALSAADGKLKVRWEVVDRRGKPWLSFDWKEFSKPIRRAPPGPGRKGFGSELIEGRIPYELGGRGKIVIEAGNASCHLEFPLEDGGSVLETDAPQRATVFGGAIDMTGEADLTDQRVLVVEDDYYLATDAARALKGAGAKILGPCPTEEAARSEMADASPTCAVLDVNLGGGRSFDLARELKKDGVPFLFITGYDQNVIPGDLASVKRLQKPVQFREIVSALAETLGIEP